MKKNFLCKNGINFNWFIFASILVLSTIFFIKPLLASRSNNEVHAMVFNKENKLIEISHIDYQKNQSDNIAIVAQLNQYKVIDSAVQLTINDQTGDTQAITYDTIGDYELGKTYLFEGYIHVINGENIFIIEKISITY